MPPQHKAVLSDEQNPLRWYVEAAQMAERAIQTALTVAFVVGVACFIGVAYWDELGPQVYIWFFIIGVAGAIVTFARSSDALSRLPELIRWLRVQVETQGQDLSGDSSPTRT